MTREDRELWDEKWAGRKAADFEPNPLLVRYADHLTGGEALDLACGLGQNALWLAEQGYQVTAVDISPVALAKGRAEAGARGLAVNFVHTDLDAYRLPETAFDVVVVFRFLDRALFPAIEAALRPGGWLFYQTHNIQRLESRPDMLRGYLLELGELKRAFAGLEWIGGGDEGDLSSVVCRRR